MYHARMLTRRDWLGLAGRLGATGVAWRLSPSYMLVGQGPAAPGVERWGKGALIARSVRPPDYETPVGLLDSFITPVEHFYVRSHLPIPTALDRSAWTLNVDGEVTTKLSLSLDELVRLPSATVTVTLECAGNGRAFFDPPVAGIQWEKGAVGTARWTGARLADVLKRAGVKSAGRNVLLVTADRPLGTMPAFTRQVPMAKAMHPDTILAYEMNGQPIPPVHGFPLRALVPGWEGAYSAKWLSGLTVIDKDYDGFFVATAYRYPTRRVAPGAVVDAADMAPLTGLVVKSLITQPAQGTSRRTGAVNVAGFAWAGETDIARVDISIDNGATWQPARLTGPRERYAWRRFEHTFAAGGPGSYLVLSRATDADGRAQPAVSAWNPSGYLWNQYDAVRIEVTNA
jgi:DMSO/TMAO reductase YedYZ molybdopterin-dependent catalytic subunit